jgi:hypothetical protein
MAEILHLTALLPALVSACCTVGAARTRGAVGVISAIVMLVAMLDLAGGGVLPPVAWSALLVASAMSGAVTARIAGASGGGPMGAHGALGLVVMAALVVLMGVTPGGGAHGLVSGGHAEHGAAGPLAGTIWAGTAAYLAYSGALILPRAALGADCVDRERHSVSPTAVLPSAGRWQRGRDRLEVAAMAASVALMSAALLA